MKFMTVGDLKAAIADISDDAQICMTDAPGGDHGMFAAHEAMLIPWEHDCKDAEEGHRPGKDCPTVVSLEIWSCQYDDLEEMSL